MPVPTSLDAPDAWAMHGSARIEAAEETALRGHPDLAFTARFLLAQAHAQTYVRTVSLVATPDPLPAVPRPDDALGVVRVRLAEEGAPAEITVHVDPAHRGRGIAEALLSAGERVAADDGRTVVITESSHTAEPDAASPHALAPSTGSGLVDRRDEGARIALAAGYSFEQGVRYSVLDLPLEDPARLDALHADAVARAGGYEVVTWAGPCPEEWVHQRAVLATRMSTAIPTGGLELAEESWDADRVRDSDRVRAASGRSALTSAALHVASGELVAYTELSLPDDGEAAFQNDTLVLDEHRGHRLGMLLKTVNLRELARTRPSTRRVHTWNAEENAHMLAINVALGFRPAGVLALWQKRLGRH
ncbi:GNAT family N-acetyltransferase [Sanguibacter suaedae]|uniref:GNAT family N-acetyltransferase n=1 Tax=Sanguibacter suaedae TaxID=2795737 RepID=A0A934ICQ7_9MICO|nr:GNAT family N-acetyltransferase [Sanguibacter suaedae]MBI9115957.1 GNAT family N-acetyltransferase [Sanguibacter suaedae]